MNPNAIFNERRWVIQICQTLREEIEDECTCPATIFNVPKTLMANNPDPYVPRQVALGPYHYLLPELYEMQKYKIIAAKRIQKHLQGLNFQHLVDQFKSLEPRIRACYHKYLNLSGETLAWMMSLDVSFIFEFLQVYDPIDDRPLRQTIKCPNTVIRDLVMLENQIPLFLLRMLEFQISLPINDSLLIALTKFCQDISPYKKIEVEANIQDTDRFHLLDYLYHKIVDKQEEISETIEAHEDHRNAEDESERNGLVNPNHVKTLFDEIWSFITKLNKAPVSFLHRVLISKPIKVILNLPWTIVTSLPGVKFLKQRFSQNPNEANNCEFSCYNEITIPSVTELFKIGLRFSPTNGGIFTVSFDEESLTLHLPTIFLDVNSEVLLRNLVAYEACNISGPLVLGRYIELMNGIVDTEGDAKLLRENGIICNKLKSDKEVAKMWNGMSKCVRITNVDSLDKVIKDLNRCYNGKLRVKVGKFFKGFAFGAWQIVILLGTVLILVLMSLQAFCSVYKCGHIYINSSYRFSS